MKGTQFEFFLHYSSSFNDIISNSIRQIDHDMQRAIK